MLQLCVVLLGFPVLLGQLRLPGAAASLWCAAAQRLLTTSELQGSRKPMSYSEGCLPSHKVGCSSAKGRDSRETGNWGIGRGSAPLPRVRAGRNKLRMPLTGVGPWLTTDKIQLLVAKGSARIAVTK